MPASPRRLARSAALCLLGGAAATVLVAWGFAATRASLSLAHSPNDIAVGWPRSAPPNWPAPLYQVVDWSVGVGGGSVSGSGVHQKTAAILHVWGFGWPFRGMDWEWQREFEQTNMFVQYVWSPPAAGYRTGVSCPGAGV